MAYSRRLELYFGRHPRLFTRTKASSTLRWIAYITRPGTSRRCAILMEVYPSALCIIILVRVRYPAWNVHEAIFLQMERMESRRLRSFFQASSSSGSHDDIDCSTVTDSAASVQSSLEEPGTSGQQSCSLAITAKRQKRAEKRFFKDEWKVRYLMWPGKGMKDDSEDTTDMICIQCQERLKAKSSTAARHLERKHPASKSFSFSKKQRLVKQFENMYAKQTSIITSALKPDELVKLAPYKLAFVIAKHKMPFSSCHAFLEFARIGDPNSLVFSRMAGGRDTVTKRTQEIHQAVLRPKLVQSVHKSPFWSLIADESTDTATIEQLGVYVRYLDLDQGKLAEDFLEMKRVVGHPDAANIFRCLMEVLEPDSSAAKLPMHKLAGFTSDGASVMISAKQGVLGKLRSAVNPKLFSSHCPPHRLVLAAKEGQKVIPDDIEKTLSDTLFFFKDSSVRRDEFRGLQELVEPDSPLMSIVVYHKVRWLSLSDCVSRMVQLLPLLVQYFEKQAEDTQNRQAVRVKCRDLHVRVSMPTFHLYLYFLNPHLDLLAKINKWLQSTQLTLNAVYCKIQALLKTFIAPVVIDNTKSINDDNNLRAVEHAVPLFPGSEFQKHLSDCVEHSLLSGRELETAKKIMYTYIVTIGKALNADSQN